MYLFGCGGFALNIRNYLGQLDIRGCLDNDVAKQGKTFYGFEAASPGAMRVRVLRENAFVVISMCTEDYVREAVAQCRELGFAHVTWAQCWPFFEKKASLGELAENRDQKPVLAISAYHEAEHLWSVARWIRDLGMGYRLLLRHHGRFISETDCYALPRD